MPRKNILTAIIFLAVCGLGVFGFSGEAQAERFYHTTNTWDVKIPSGHPTTSGSTYYITDIRENSLPLAASFRAIPVYYAESNTPIITVKISPYLKDTNPGLTEYIIDNHWDDVPIPNGAVPAYNDNNCATPATSLHDGYMVVISADRNWAWQFHSAGHCNGPNGWQNGEANPNDASSGRWDAYFVRKIDLRGDGLLLSNPTQQNPYGTYDMLGAPRAGAADHLHGLVTYKEVEAGEINHALAYAYSSSEDGWGVYPSVIAVYGTPCASATNPERNCLKLGMRLQLDPTLDITTLGLNSTGLIVAKALQEYGMIFVINNGINTYTGKGYQNVEFESLENPLTSGKSWKGPDSPLDFPLPNLDKIPTNRFRVVEPVLPSSFTTQTYQCSDGIDNDSDGLIDYPNDPGCSSATDNDESNTVSITSPTPDSTLTGSTQEFTWNTNGTAVTAWYLWAGPCNSEIFGGCGDDYYNSGQLGSGTLTKTATNLPTDGSTVYVRLWYQESGVWQSTVFTYTAHTQVGGNEYYIDEVADGGTDSGNCPISAPCATIAYASTKLVAGDTLYVRGGTYDQGANGGRETIYQGPSGTAGNPITIRNYPGEIVIFDGNQVDGPSDGSQIEAVFIWDYFWTVYHRYLIIDGFTFQKYRGSTIGIAEQAANITVQNCIFKDIKTEAVGQNLGHGIYISNFEVYTPQYITIRNNYFNTYSGIGIQFNHGSESNVSGRNVDIYNNIFDSSLRGIQLGYWPTDIKIYNNTFYGNEEDIRIASAPNLILKNNISYTTAGKLFLNVWGTGGGIAEIDHNLVYHTGTGKPIWWNNVGNSSGGSYYTLEEFRATTVHEDNGVSDNPSLVDPANDDFTIPTGSPAKDAGATIALVTTDKIGTARPQGGIYDIGAYEYGNPADVNSDTHVNIKDIQACIKVITGSDMTYEEQCSILAPPTDRTNIKDIQVIIRAIIGG